MPEPENVREETLVMTRDDAENIKVSAAASTPASSEERFAAALFKVSCALHELAEEAAFSGGPNGTFESGMIQAAVTIIEQGILGSDHEPVREEWIDRLNRRLARVLADRIPPAPAPQEPT